jgi:hypothetical protein
VKAKEKAVALVLEKNTEIVESSDQCKARAIKGINKPYCNLCLSKGHVKEECAALLIYDICSSQSHLNPRYPLQRKATKIYAMTCVYAVDGLGFYYIMHQASARPKGDHNTPVIKVLEGTLTGDQVALEMEKLVPGPTKWECRRWIEKLSRQIFNQEWS